MKAIRKKPPVLEIPSKSRSDRFEIKLSRSEIEEIKSWFETNSRPEIVAKIKNRFGIKVSCTSVSRFKDRYYASTRVSDIVGLQSILANLTTASKTIRQILNRAARLKKHASSTK